MSLAAATAPLNMYMYVCMHAPSQRGISIIAVDMTSCHSSPSHGRAIAGRASERTDLHEPTGRHRSRGIRSRPQLSEHQSTAHLKVEESSLLDGRDVDHIPPTTCATRPEREPHCVAIWCAQRVTMARPVKWRVAPRASTPTQTPRRSRVEREAQSNDPLEHFATTTTASIQACCGIPQEESIRNC